MNEYLNGLFEGYRLLENKVGANKCFKLYSEHRLEHKLKNLDLYHDISKVLDYEIMYSNDFLKYANEVLGNE